MMPMQLDQVPALYDAGPPLVPLNEIFWYEKLSNV